MDYFDRVCQRKKTIILSGDESVNDLWEKRYDLLIPHKKERMKRANDSFIEIIRRTHEGHEYSVSEMHKTKYWDAMKCYHKSWGETPLSSRAERQMRYKFRDGVALYHDIKKRGMIDPLDIIVENLGMCLYRGNRRLSILKVLGIKRASVRYAVSI